MLRKVRAADPDHQDLHMINSIAQTMASHVGFPRNPKGFVAANDITQTRFMHTNIV